MDRMQAGLVLNVERNADPDTIKAAYRRMVLECHPDKNNGDDVKFKEVTMAYHILVDGASDESGPVQDGQSARESAGPSSRARWGAGPTDKVPEEDWGRYTAEFEEDEAWWKAYEDRFWQEYDRHVKGGAGAESEKAKEPHVQPVLKVDVDQSLCIGCCSCETIAPDVFEINRTAKSNPKSNVKNSRGAGVNRIMNAAETCPTKAIIVENLHTGEQMYPF